MDNILYDFAVSYASEQREYVKKFVQFLKKRRYNVYYDRDEQIKMTGRLLHEELNEIYSKKSNIRVIFLSKEYIEKPTTYFEAEIIIAENMYEKHKMFVFKFDNVSLPGLNRNLIYSDINEFPNPEDYAKFMIAIKDNRPFSVSENLFLKAEVLMKHALSNLCEQYGLIFQESSQLNVRIYRLFSGNKLIIYFQYEWDAERKILYFWLYPTEPMDKTNNYNGRVEEIHMTSTKTHILVQNSGIIDILATDIKYESLDQFVQILMEKIRSMLGIK